MSSRRRRIHHHIHQRRHRRIGKTIVGPFAAGVEIAHHAQLGKFSSVHRGHYAVGSVYKPRSRPSRRKLVVY